MANLASPLFVIGNPRSGTSLFRLLLTSHSKMMIPPECGFIVWLHNDFKHWCAEDIDAKLDVFLDRLNACKKFDTWEVNLDKLKSFLQENKPANYSELCAYVYLHYSSRFSKHVAVWGDKNNFHINCLDDLITIYPEAKFIHLVRDGRDVYCSYLDVMSRTNNSPYSPILKTDIKDVAQEWHSNLTKVEEFFSKNPQINAKTVRYEDLIISPQAILTDVFSWCGFEYEPSVLDFFRQNISMNLEPEKTMEWKAKTKHPIDSANFGKYKKIISKDQIRKFDEIARESLLHYGYEL
jgi:hypothetical protein